MKYLILFVSVLVLSVSALSGVHKMFEPKVWQPTFETDEIKCAITIVQTSQTKFKSEVICFSKTK